MSGPAWRLRLPQWLTNLIVGAVAYWRGRADERERQRKSRDALQEQYDEIADSHLDVDDAFERLRDRSDRLP